MEQFTIPTEVFSFLEFLYGSKSWLISAILECDKDIAQDIEKEFAKGNWITVLGILQTLGNDNLLAAIRRMQEHALSLAGTILANNQDFLALHGAGENQHEGD